MTLLLAKGSLSSNLVLEAKLALASAGSVGTQAEFEFLSLNCTAHQCVISMKPSMERQEGLCSAMVRTGHIFQNGKFVDQWVKAVFRIADTGSFRAVRRFPPGVGQWQRTFQLILKFSRPALDIADGDEEFLRTHANGDPFAVVPQHLHKPGCPCGGLAKTRANWRRVFEILFCGGCPLCLLYRWKGFETASCFLYRCKLLWGSILDRIPGWVFDSKTVAEAERDQALAAQQGDDNYRANHAVRGGKAKDWFKADTGGKQMWKAVLLNRPQQIYLNHLFDSETQDGVGQCRACHS